MPLVTEFSCDVCNSRSSEPHFKIGEKYGEPLHAHQECLPILLTMAQGIISNSAIKKELNFNDESMISTNAYVPSMIDPVEEVKKPEILEKIMEVKRRTPVFVRKLRATISFIEENINFISTLSTWDCLYE